MYYTVKIAHISMQFNDTELQMRVDAKRIFKRARAQNYAWITGTEAGGGSPLREILRTTAHEHEYRFYSPRGSDSWIAVAMKEAHRDWVTRYDKVIDGVANKHTDKGIARVSFFNNELGHVNVFTLHLLTHGAKPGEPNYEKNALLLSSLGKHVVVAGKNKNLCFYGGDQNIQDRTDDTFMGKPLTSAWDELGIYEGTGHGVVDVIASYDYDKRVSAITCRSLDDSEMYLHTDHFLIEAEYQVIS